MDEQEIYSEWDKAYELRSKRLQFYEAVLKKHGPDYILTKHCKTKFEEADRAYEAVVEKL